MIVIIIVREEKHSAIFFVIVQYVINTALLHEAFAMYSFKLLLSNRKYCL